MDIPATLAYYTGKLGFACLGTWQDPPVYAIVAPEPLRYTVIPSGKTVKRRLEETVIRAACGFLRSFTQRPTPLPLVLLAEALTVSCRSQ
jgi:hypothetical protein